MVDWEKPVTRYNKNNNNKNNNKNLHCHMHKDTYAGDREWLNARGKKSLRSARLHLCSLSLASLLLRSLALSIVTVQRSLPIVLILYCSLASYTALYSLLWSNIKVPTGVVNPVQLTTTRVILISPRKWSGLGQYQYQSFYSRNS